MNNWKDITPDALRKHYYSEQLSDNDIGKIYGVSRTTVQKKRSEYGITFNMKLLEGAMQSDNELYAKLNQDAKERLLNKDNIDWIAKALSIYLFRNGPIENIHSSGKSLSDEDMKNINIYFSNRMAGILTILEQGHWLILEQNLKFCAEYAINWQETQPDTEELERYFLMHINSIFPITEP